MRTIVGVAVVNTMRTPPSTIDMAERYDFKMIRVLRGDENAGKIMEASRTPGTDLSSPVQLLIYRQIEQLSSTVYSMCGSSLKDRAFLSPLAPLCSRLIHSMPRCFTRNLTHTRFPILFDLIVWTDFGALIWPFSLRATLIGPTWHSRPDGRNVQSCILTIGLVTALIILFFMVL